MARTGTREIHPYYQAPTSPPAEPREVPIPFDQPGSCYAEITGEIAALLLGQDAMILVPREYDGDDSPDAYWRKQATASACFKTCIAYLKLKGEEHPHIVPYSLPLPPVALFLQHSEASKFS
jgi:hypothetical protein